ncbi:MAG: peptidyl-prolyl cis-trans isomerase [Candidatus Aminicenantes bacterium]|nr:peptidyl-prolyl cis-trans isomerase [Candidatus Aminicenantes bacterium]
MIKNLILLSFVCIFLLSFYQPGNARETSLKVLMKTTKGDITLELYPDKAPVTVENFLKYVDDQFYDGTIFHRVIADFMIQGGGHTEDFTEKPSGPPIKNEADNGLKNNRGTIAMARTNEPHSATNQFFINHVDNSFLDHTAKTEEGYGYCVFGKVIEGMDVVDAIATVSTDRNDAPRETVKIISVRRISSQP